MTAAAEQQAVQSSPTKQGWLGCGSARRGALQQLHNGCSKQQRPSSVHSLQAVACVSGTSGGSSGASSSGGSCQAKAQARAAGGAAACDAQHMGGSSVAEAASAAAQVLHGAGSSPATAAAGDAQQTQMQQQQQQQQQQSQQQHSQQRFVQWPPPPAATALPQQQQSLPLLQQQQQRPASQPMLLMIPPPPAPLVIASSAAAQAAAAAVAAAPAALAAAAGPPTAQELGPQRCRRLADVLLRCGKAAEATGWADAALATAPWDVELLLLRGRCLEAAGNVPGAFTSFMSALALHPSHVPCLTALASLYKSKGMLDEARAALETALQAAEAAGAADGAAAGEAAGAAGVVAAAPVDQITGSKRGSAGADSGSRREPAAAAAGSDGDGAAAGSGSGSGSASSSSAVSVSAVREALAVVLTDLGTRAKTAGRTPECEGLYRQAVALCPSYASAHYNLGVLASEGKRWGEALQHYQDTLALAPHHAQALCNSGVVYRELERLEEAVAAYEAALAVAPNYPIVRTNLAVALTDLGTSLKLKGHVAAGIAMYERALALAPRHADALYNLGVACAEAGQVERAMFCYELTTHFNPGCAEAWNNLGVLHKEADNRERAAECYLAALHIRPNFPQSLNNLAVVLTSQGKAGEALALLQAAIAACPGYAEAHNNLGVLQRDVGAIPDALASYERALALVPDSRNAGQNRLLALNYVHSGDDPAVCAAHTAWGDAFQAAHSGQLLPEVTPEQRAGRRGQPLRVGYVSPDLFTHSVSYFVEAPLLHHSGSRVALYVYSCVAKADAKTLRLQQQVVARGGVWRDVGQLSEQQLAALVRQDEIDILVELTGHTANNRLGVCAMRAAPVQVTWIGYPNSTGLAAVDYRLTDAICDPPDTKQTFAEALVRLPGCFLCYSPAPDAPPVSPLPAASNGFVTFGSFNNLAKITPAVLALWARILHSVPASRLVLKAKPFSCPAARHHIGSQLEAAGVPSWRVDLLPLTAGTAEHLSVYSLMDISLDPFPYAGTTTTTESLLMGVPVITLRGTCHAQNVSASLLSAVGIADAWVAEDEESYVRLAISHASNVPGLAALRQRLRPLMLASRMCDAAPFVGALEDTYEQLWGAWHAQGGRRRPLLAGSGAAAQAAAAAAAAQQAQQHAVQQAQQQGKGSEGAAAGSGSGGAAAAAAAAHTAVAAAAAGGGSDGWQPGSCRRCAGDGAAVADQQRATGGLECACKQQQQAARAAA